jgi:hypothetical protein
MTFDEFTANAKKVFFQGRVFLNPGGGTSEIISFSNAGTINYLRGKSIIGVNIIDFYNAYKKFKGKQCTSNNLKTYDPKVFDSKFSGHSCNCTVFFMLLLELKLSKGILGEGVRGSPFNVFIE